MKDKKYLVINEYLRNKRIESGWTQLMLSERSGISKNTIGNLECARSLPELRTVLRIAAALKID